MSFSTGEVEGKCRGYQEEEIQKERRTFVLSFSLLTMSSFSPLFLSQFLSMTELNEPVLPREQTANSVVICEILVSFLLLSQAEFVS